VLLEEGLAVAGHVKLDREVKRSLGGSEGAFCASLGDAILSFLCVGVRSDNAGLSGIPGRSRAAHLLLVGEDPKVVIQNGGDTRTPQDRGDSTDLILNHLLSHRSLLGLYYLAQRFRRGELRRLCDRLRHDWDSQPRRILPASSRMGILTRRSIRTEYSDFISVGMEHQQLS
jgi:hypothetical protein